MKKEKLKVGFYGVTGCAGCQLSIIFEGDKLLDVIDMVDIQAWPFVKDFNIEEKFDYIFMEGLVASNDDLKTLKKLRKNSKFLVALGTCAHTGCIPAYRHFSLKENYAHLLYKKDKNIQDIQPSPLNEHVKVDYIIPGCPPDKKEILKFLEDISNNKKPVMYDQAVCIECRKNNPVCLLKLGIPCLGPITRGGCNAVCINGGLECWGCRGPKPNAQVQGLINTLLKQGHSKKFIKDRIHTFMGKTIPEIKKSKVEDIKPCKMDKENVKDNKN
jgi:sulfhydrogenase subunit delta